MVELNAMRFSYNASALFGVHNSPNTIPKGLYAAMGSMRGFPVSLGMVFTSTNTMNCETLEVYDHLYKWS